ncbi:MAG: hypothetical protein MUP63_03485, partial [Candidatus Nanohaloarchaeota archaeon QJJ-7]|nr:hypothetical protein [Candidatus Nanohaloarchaeota archaeon QJJ-7]
GMMTAMMYYSIIILNHLQGPEGSIASFFVDERTPLAFEVMAGSLLIFSAGMIYGSLGSMLEVPLLMSISAFGAFIGGIGFIYFLREISVITDAHQGSAVVNRYLSR